MARKIYVNAGEQVEIRVVSMEDAEPTATEWHDQLHSMQRSHLIKFWADSVDHKAAHGTTIMRDGVPQH